MPFLKTSSRRQTRVHGKRTWKPWPGRIPYYDRRAGPRWACVCVCLYYALTSRERSYEFRRRRRTTRTFPPRRHSTRVLPREREREKPTFIRFPNRNGRRRGLTRRWTDSRGQLRRLHVRGTVKGQRGGCTVDDFGRVGVHVIMYSSSDFSGRKHDALYDYRRGVHRIQTEPTTCLITLFVFPCRRRDEFFLFFFGPPLSPDVSICKRV